jgi:peptidase E
MERVVANADVIIVSGGNTLYAIEYVVQRHVTPFCSVPYT